MCGQRQERPFQKGFFSLSLEESLESLESLNSLESLEDCRRTLLVFLQSGGSLESQESLNSLESLANGVL